MEPEVIEVPVIGRAAELRSVNAEARTVEVTWTTGAQVRRYSWARDEEFDEELVVDPAAMRLDRLNAGAPFLNSHSSYRLEAILGVVVDGSVRIADGVGTATIRFSDREDVEPVWRDIQNGIIRNVSVGYRVHRFERIAKEDRKDGGQRALYRAVDWEPMEISAVAIGADPKAQFRGDPDAALTRCAIVDRAVPAAPAASRKESIMEPETTPAAGTATPASTDVRAAEEAARQAAETERQRAAAILSLYQRHGLADNAPKAISDGLTLDQARAAVLDHLAAQTDPAGARSEPTLTGRLDETETRRRGMEEALVARFTGGQVTDLGRTYAGLDLVDLAAERLGERRVPSSFGQREQLLQRAFHSTSDFPFLFENALNKSLQARYMTQEPTYRRIARRRTYVDFRDHTTIRVGDFPTLLPVDTEAGEIKGGTFSEARERTRVLPYGVRVNLSRTMLVNDTIGGITQVLTDRASAVARFEDATFYAMAFGGAGSNGPTLLETTRQVFNTTDATLAGTNAAITIASLTVARAALRKRKSREGADLELTPRILLVGPDKETEAQQIVAPIQAQQAGNVNPFSGVMEIVTTAKITGLSWYVFADPSEAPVFEYGFLEGYEAPRFRIEEVFGMQGTSLTLEHDFGCGAIDFRGGFRNIGA
jgi:hypothetical protein